MQLACGMQPEAPRIAETRDAGITSEHSSSSDGGTEDGPQASALIAVGMQMGWNVIRERDPDANRVVELSDDDWLVRLRAFRAVVTTFEQKCIEHENNTASAGRKPRSRPLSLQGATNACKVACARKEAEQARQEAES